MSQIQILRIHLNYCISGEFANYGGENEFATINLQLIVSWVVHVNIFCKMASGGMPIKVKVKLLG